MFGLCSSLLDFFISSCSDWEWCLASSPGYPLLAKSKKPCGPSACVGHRTKPVGFCFFQLKFSSPVTTLAGRSIEPPLCRASGGQEVVPSPQVHRVAFDSNPGGLTFFGALLVDFSQSYVKTVALVYAESESWHDPACPDVSALVFS